MDAPVISSLTDTSSPSIVEHCDAKHDDVHVLQSEITKNIKS